MVELTLSHVLPFIFRSVKESLHLSLTSFVTILEKFSKLGLNLSVSFHDNLNVEIVHHIRIVSFKRDTIRSNDDSVDAIQFFSFVIFFILNTNFDSLNFNLFAATLLGLVLFISDLGSKDSHSEFPHKDIPVVIHFNVHLNCMDDI